MAETYSWHPGSKAVNNRFLKAVPILPDEMFSSWLIRLAFSHGTDAMTVADYLFPKKRFWTTDPDWSLDEGMASKLSLEAGVNIDALFFTTLSEALNIGGKPDSEWNSFKRTLTLTLGLRNRTRKGGIQYCPHCLLDNETAYFKIQWRLLWHTCCPKHRCALFDRCGSCKAVVEPHKLTYDCPNITSCSHCFTLLSARPAKQVTSDLISFQEYADSVVLRKSGQFGGFDLSPKDWFTLLNHFIRLQRRAVYHQGLQRVLGLYGVPVLSDHDIPLHVSNNTLPSHVRHELLKGSMRIYEEGLGSLIAYSNEAELRIGALINKSDPFPADIKSVLINRVKNRPTRSFSASSGAKRPVDRACVKRMYSRVLRDARRKSVEA